MSTLRQNDTDNRPTKLDHAGRRQTADAHLSRERVRAHHRFLLARRCPQDRGPQGRGPRRADPHALSRARPISGRRRPPSATRWSMSSSVRSALMCRRSRRRPISSRGQDSALGMVRAPASDANQGAQGQAVAQTTVIQAALGQVTRPPPAADSTTLPDNAASQFTTRFSTPATPPVRPTTWTRALK